MKVDLGHPIDILYPTGRVVSLIPSLTEPAAVTRPGALARATQRGTHQQDLDVPRLRGPQHAHDLPGSQARQHPGRHRKGIRQQPGDAALGRQPDRASARG